MKHFWIRNGAALLGAVLAQGSFAATQPSPDNSAINERDRSLMDRTAYQQSVEPSDAELSRLIRRELMKDSSLSTYGQNVKIITEHGQVTLRGPVRSSEEKNSIEETARRIAGNKAVSSELQVAP